MDAEPRLAPEPKTAEELSAPPRPKKRLVFIVSLAAAIGSLLLAADGFGIVHLSRRVLLVALAALTLGIVIDTAVSLRQKEKTDDD